MEPSNITPGSLLVHAQELELIQRARREAAADYGQEYSGNKSLLRELADALTQAHKREAIRAEIATEAISRAEKAEEANTHRVPISSLDINNIPVLLSRIQRQLDTDPKDADSSQQRDTLAFAQIILEQLLKEREHFIQAIFTLITQPISLKGLGLREDLRTAFIIECGKQLHQLRTKASVIRSTLEAIAHHHLTGTESLGPLSRDEVTKGLSRALYEPGWCHLHPKDVESIRRLISDIPDNPSSAEEIRQIIEEGERRE